MKRIKSLISIVILAAAHTSFAATTRIDYVTRAAHQIEYATHAQGQQNVWPGFHPGSTATVIQFGQLSVGDKRSLASGSNEDKVEVYALNFKPGVQPWMKLPSNYSIYFYIGDPGLLNLKTNTFATVDGQPAFIYIEENDLSVAEMVYYKLMYERASYYMKHEAPIDIKQSAYMQIGYDSFNNPELMKLFYLEDAALTLSQQPDSGKAETALRDAVAIHQYRNQLTSKSAKEYENGNELMNGTAAYIMWTSRELNDDEYRKMSQRFGCMPLSALQGSLGMVDCVNKAFPVFASSVYGHALDKKSSNHEWKPQVEKQFKSISSFAIDYYHFSDETAKAATEQAMKNPAYRYDRISRVVDATMKPYLEKLAVAQQKYQALSGVEFRTTPVLGMLVMLAGMFENDMDDMYIVNSNQTLFDNVNLEGVSESDENVIEFKNLQYMSLNIVAKGFDVDEENSYSAMKLDENAKLTLDGKATTVGEFVRKRTVQSFQKSFALEDAHFRMVLTASGKVDASEGVLKFMEIAQNDKVVVHNLVNQWKRKHHVTNQQIQEKLARKFPSMALSPLSLLS